VSLFNICILLALISWALGAANVAFKRGTPNWLLLGLAFVALSVLVGGVRL
jgi:hypothetical protein